MNIMKIAMPLALTALTAFAAVAYADNEPASHAPLASTQTMSTTMTPAELAVKDKAEKRLGDGAKIDSVRKTNFSGLYELRAEGQVMYTDEQAKYLVIGSIVDMETHKNYTRESLSELNKINFSDLPFDSSIKMVKGNGKRVIAVFEDPNCGYCKKLRQTLAKMDNVTVYTFMYNILAPDSSPAISKNVWCTQDRVKAWDDWMLHSKSPAQAPATCTSNPNDKVLALGQKLHITGTPTIFFTDGTRTPGFLEGPALEEKWSSIQ